MAASSSKVLYSGTNQLIYAIERGDNNAAKALINAGSGLNVQESSTPLHWAARYNRLEIARLIIAVDRNAVKRVDEREETPLQWAAKKESFVRMLALLIDSNSDLSHRNIDAEDALRIACKGGNINVAFMLLYRGADPNNKDAAGRTNLHYLISIMLPDVAAELKRLQFLQLLLHMGADPTARDSTGNTALHYTCDQPTFSGFAFDPKWDPGVALILIESGENMITDEMVVSNSAIVSPTLLLRKRRPFSLNPVFFAENIEGLYPAMLAIRARNRYMIRFLNDLFFFKTLPRVVPSVAIALSLFSLMPMMQSLGVFYAVPIFICVVLPIMSQFMQATIDRENSRHYNGAAHGVLSSIVWSHFTNVAPHFSSPFISATTLLLAGTVYFTFFKASLTPPITIPKFTDRQALYYRIWESGAADGSSLEASGLRASSMSSSSLAHYVSQLSEPPDEEKGLGSAGGAAAAARSESASASASLDVGRQGTNSSGTESSSSGSSGVVTNRPIKLCCACCVDKTLATTHCASCNVCVLSLDHHCPFIDNCVGLGNRRMFVCFALSASVGSAYQAILSFIVQRTVVCPKAHGTFFSVIAVQACTLKKNPSLFLASVYACLCALWIGAIALQQMAYVAGETTTFEVLKRTRDESSPRVDRQRALRNLLVFFRTGFSLTRQQQKLQRELRISAGGVDATADAEDSLAWQVGDEGGGGAGWGPYACSGSVGSADGLGSAASALRRLNEFCNSPLVCGVCRRWGRTWSVLPHWLLCGCSGPVAGRADRRNHASVSELERIVSAVAGEVGSNTAAGGDFPYCGSAGYRKRMLSSSAPGFVSAAMAEGAPAMLV